MSGASALLVIGIHREELPFGEAVAAGVDRGGIDVLAIPEGIAGRRPRPDECFRYAALHRELYLQLLRHVVGRYALMIDLHNGVDPHGPSADLYCGDDALRAALAEALRGRGGPPVRLIAMGAPARTGASATPYADTVIPERIFRNPAFRYVGIEIYLAQPGRGQPSEWAFARDLIEVVARATQPAAPLPRIVVT